MFLPVVLFLFFLSSAVAQPKLAGEAEIRQALDRLDTLGTVLIIAAHPDDEPNALLAYFSRGRHMRTAYLSLTRGEGGQNLIGRERGDELGVLRTQELLSAHRYYGAEQYFTRAIDFGFSKTAAETLSQWPRDKVLGDVVWVIRRVQPDVIVLSFSGTPRDGHGQHQVSAILGREAYSAAGDASRFPEQLRWVQPWRARRLMYNAFGNQPAANRTNPNRPNSNQAAQAQGAAPSPDSLEIDAGAYDPELGFSYNQIGAMGRSQHRSQGQGTPERRGVIKTYLNTVAGEKAARDVFDGIDTGWTRFPGGAAIHALLDRARNSFQPGRPELLVPALLEIRPLIAAIKDPLAAAKLGALDETLALAAGVWLDATADKPTVAGGGSLKVNLTALDRAPGRVTLEGASLTGIEGAPALDLAPAVLALNQPRQYPLTVRIPDDEPISQPYWLIQPKDGNLYSVPDARQIGDPENPPVILAHFRLNIAGAGIELTRPVEFRSIDPIYGERVRPLAIVPSAGVNLSADAWMLPDTAPHRIEVPVQSNGGRAAGDVRLEAPAGWRIEPASRHFEIANADEQATAEFEVIPPATADTQELHASVSVDGRTAAARTEVIDYPHIQTQVLFPPAERKLVRADIRVNAHSVGYIMGTGDDIPDALRQLGLQVTLLEQADLERGDLARFDAIVAGVRAYDVRPDLRANQPRLMEFVRNGGTYIVQYNRVKTQNLGPYPFTETAGDQHRVAEEDAAVALPHPDNPLLQRPNRITPSDFEGWVQERGLYFATAWDPRYEPLFSTHDTGEEPQLGGTLYTRYGSGVYVFTAFSWFRQLPAGVPGAYRLFANFLSAAKSQ